MLDQLNTAPFLLQLMHLLLFVVTLPVSSASLLVSTGRVLLPFLTMTRSLLLCQLVLGFRRLARLLLVAYQLPVVVSILNASGLKLLVPSRVLELPALASMARLPSHHLNQASRTFASFMMPPNFFRRHNLLSFSFSTLV